MDHQAKDRNNFNLRSFSSDVLIFSSGQLVLLIFGFIQSLIIPKYLDKADYGYWQLFLLCTIYLGILHLGFLDGIFVRWAGKDLEEIKEEIPKAFRFILLELGVIVGILAIIVGLIDISSKEIAIAVLANAIIINLLVFFLYIAQSTKRFRLVTAANIGRGLLFFIFILIFFFNGYFNYILLILATTVAGLIILLILVFHFRDSLFLNSKYSGSLFRYGKENIGIGLFVLLGNFIALIFSTIDMLTVGSFFSITQFAVYAFAVTMVGLVMVFILAVGQVFFPYLSGSNSETRIKAYSHLRPSLVIFWAAIIAAYFPFSVWIRYYLPTYTESLPLIAILLCTVGFSGQIQILHTNFFKVYRQQRVYFFLAGISLIGAIVLNLLAVKIFSTLAAVAVTAVISFSFWYLLNEVTLRNLVATPIKDIIKWLLVVCLYIGAFLGAYILAETWVVGFGIYLILFAGITAVCLRKETVTLWIMFRGILKRTGDV